MYPDVSFLGFFAFERFKTRLHENKFIASTEAQLKSKNEIRLTFESFFQYCCVICVSKTTHAILLQMYSKSAETESKQNERITSNWIIVWRNKQDIFLTLLWQYILLLFIILIIQVNAARVTVDQKRSKIISLFNNSSELNEKYLWTRKKSMNIELSYKYYQ